MTSVIERRLTCEHGEWKKSPSSSLSSIWCHECEDLVECEFRRVKAGMGRSGGVEA